MLEWPQNTGLLFRNRYNYQTCNKNKVQVVFIINTLSESFYNVFVV